MLLNQRLNWYLQCFYYQHLICKWRKVQLRTWCFICFFFIFLIASVDTEHVYTVWNVVKRALPRGEERIYVVTPHGISVLVSWPFVMARAKKYICLSINPRYLIHSTLHIIIWPWQDHCLTCTFSILVIIFCNVSKCLTSSHRPLLWWGLPATWASSWSWPPTIISEMLRSTAFNIH